MARLKLSNKRFQNIVSDIVAETTRIQGTAIYDLTFNENGASAYIVPTHNVPFYNTYFDEFCAITTLYDCSMWFEVKDGKPCLVFING